MSSDVCMAIFPQERERERKARERKRGMKKTDITQLYCSLDASICRGHSFAFSIKQQFTNDLSCCRRVTFIVSYINIAMFTNYKVF